MENLLQDILQSIFSLCTPYERVLLSRVCKQFQELIGLEVYHSYYLYSLEWLTPETPLDKRFLNLIARKTYKAGKLDLQTVTILEARGHNLSEIRIRMGDYVSLADDDDCDEDYHSNYSKTNNLLSEDGFNSSNHNNDYSETNDLLIEGWFSSSNSKHDDCDICNYNDCDYDDCDYDVCCDNSHPNFSKTNKLLGCIYYNGYKSLFEGNKHDEIFDEMNKENHFTNWLYHLTYKSDAITTAMCLTQVRDIEQHLEFLLHKAVQFVWVDNAESLSVILKFTKPRLGYFPFKGFLHIIYVQICARDAVKCYLEITKNYDIAMDGIAEIFHSKGILGFCESEKYSFWTPITRMVLDKYQLIRDPFICHS